MKRLLISCLLFSACGTAPVSQPKIVNGLDVLSSNFTSVVMLVRDEGERSMVCTGTWISPTVVLTAAHCMQGVTIAADGRAAVSFNILEPKTPSPDGKNADFITRSIAAYRNPTWSSNINAGVVAQDLGLVVFPAQGPGERLRSVSKISRKAPAINSRVYLIGYGATEVEDNGSGTGTEHKRAGFNSVGAISDGFITFESESTSSNRAGRGAGGASGDSGGPLFNEQLEIVGVCSGGRLSFDGRDLLNEYVDLNSTASQTFLRRYSSIIK